MDRTHQRRGSFRGAVNSRGGGLQGEGKGGAGSLGSGVQKGDGVSLGCVRSSETKSRNPAIMAIINTLCRSDFQNSSHACGM